MDGLDPTLGIRPYSNADAAVDRDFGRSQVAAIQGLGAQLREDMTNIFTSREAKKMASALMQLRPDDKSFPQQQSAMEMSFPLASQTPQGKTALSILGKAHSDWRQQTLAEQRLASQEKMAGVRADRPVNVPNTSAGLYRPKSQEFISREELGLTGLPEKETPQQGEERQKRLIEHRAKFRAGGKSKLQAIKNGDGTVAYFFDAETGESFTPEELDAPNTSPRPPAPKTPSAAAVKLIGQETDNLIAKKGELEKAKIKGSFFGLGKPDAAEIARLEKEVAELGEKVKSSGAALGVNLPPPTSELGPEALIPPGAPGPQTVAQNKIELAKRALQDPNASEAHKAAARKILGL